MKLHVCLTALSLLLTGCATAPPNTPGAGSGQTYTPVVDMQGVDPGRYSKDLGECRTYAGTIDSGKAGLDGAIGGAIVGAVISAMLGGNSRTNMQVGSATGFTGLAAAESRAMGKQERIIVNCMAGRGYRTLDAAFVMPGQPVMQQTANAPIPTVLAEQPAPARRTGEDTINAERVAKEQSCATQPRAALVAKGPGFETYSMACISGDTMMVRCEFGNCRALR